MRSVRLLPIVLVLALSLACTLSPMVSPPATQTPTPTIPVPTRTPPPPTATAYRTPTPLPNTPVPPTPTLPQAAFTAEVLGERLNLRVGPSTLHTIIGTVTKGTYVSVIGKAPGDEWVFVESTSGKAGWLSVQFLQLHGSLSSLEDVQVKSSYIIAGQVVDSAGTPVNGVDLAVYQGEGPNQLRTDATSDATGHFYAYLPVGAQGTWTVEVVGVSCQSWIMDTSCRYHGVFSSKGKETIQPPLSEPLYFVFDNQVQ